MPLSTGTRPERGAAKAVVRRAVELGVTFIDTADIYCLGEHEIGHNERLVAEALAETDHRGRVVVATKGGLVRRLLDRRVLHGSDGVPRTPGSVSSKLPAQRDSNPG